MTNKFSEDEVHQFIYQRGLEELIDDVPDANEEEAASEIFGEEGGFEFWRIIKAKAEDKLRKIHGNLPYGQFVGSKIKLSTGKKRPMELDLLGFYDDGIFVLELKINRSAERNAFSELFAYSNYIAEMFALSGHKDITNVLVARLDAQITKQAFLYDLLIADRNIIVYKPEFSGVGLETLRLKLYLPSDEDFQHFTNQLLSHDAMACVVASFEDIPGWIDSKETGGGLDQTTMDHLEAVSGYAAQLMEAERLHGFCFIRKPWQEMPTYYRNSLIICAVNPFEIIAAEQLSELTEQLDDSNDINALLESPKMAFHGRLLRLARKALDDTLKEEFDSELENPLWNVMVTSMAEVVFTRNFGFRPTGLMREAYVAYLNDIYKREAQGDDSVEDVSILKVEEISNWLRAWIFMEGCGFANSDD